MTAPLLESRVPIVAAPMAGGPSTVSLARAVVTAGGFPFLAGGYQTPAALAAEIEQARDLGAEFGVNLFVPSHEPVDATAFAAYAAELRAEAGAYGLELDPTPVVDDDRWDEKLALLLAAPVPVVSLTSGLPGHADIAALRGVGTRVLASVTTVDEARLARAAGVDGLVVQGHGAGAHSATFDGTRDPEPGDTAVLVERVIQAVDLQVIAAGGVDTDRLHLWAGTGWRNATTGPAADVIHRLSVGR